jgi:hypothetical protein
MNPRQHVASFLRFTRSAGESLLKDLPPDKAAFQPCPTDNHVLWVLGHLTGTDVWIASLVGAKGTSQPEGWDKLFGTGSRPLPDLKKYPPLEQVRKVYDANRSALLNWLESASESALAKPLKEESQGFAADVLDAFYKLGWHEGWHFGQVAGVRKALGLPAIFG